MCHVLRAGSELKHRKNLRQRINHQPEPLPLRLVAQPGSQFIQLQMWEVQMAEETFMQGLCMFPRASPPGGDRGWSNAEDPRSLRRIQPLGQRPEHQRGPWRPDGKGFSTGTTGCCEGRVNVVRQA